MCVAIYKPKGKIIDRDVLHDCFDYNPDGAGFMFPTNDRVITSKGYFTFDAFWQAYKPIQDLECAIHFRIRTHGDKDKTNCHPHRIKRGLYFVHNGMLPITVPKGISLSDSIWYARTVLSRLPDGWEYDQGALSVLGKEIGANKFIVLNSRGHFAIVNEHLGAWRNDVWFSNLNHELFSWYAPETLCEVCGCELLTEYRKEIGICVECDQYYDSCEACGIELLGESELQLGLCYKCMSPRNTYTEDMLF